VITPASLGRRARGALRYAGGRDAPEVGATPRELVWTRDTAQLWRYRNDAVTCGPPVLVVHSLVSRSYVLDLYRGNSAIAFLLRAGLDVLLLDWAPPDEADAENTLETYADDYLPHAIAAARAVTGADELTVLGYCLGGDLALLSLARHPELPVRNLALMATPVDFTHMGALSALVRRGRLDAADLVDRSGNVPPGSVETAFRLLKPTGEAAQYANLWQRLCDEEYVEGYQAMNRWVHDHVPFPGAAFEQLVEQLIRDNALMAGTLELGGRRVDLGEIRCPVLSVVAERDHIVPLRAAEPIPRLVGAEDASELRLRAGHVGLVAGRSAAKVTLPGIAGWIREHGVAA
jgi:polyhydroxyalkanoate synthase subunit PhaC